MRPLWPRPAPPARLRPLGVLVATLALLAGALPAEAALRQDPGAGSTARPPAPAPRLALPKLALPQLALPQVTLPQVRVAGPSRRAGRTPALAPAEGWSGYAFDACRAPSRRVMDRWWVASPFRGVGIYLGGVHRACEQRHLTASWVRHQHRQGWKLLPIWVGPQAACTSYRFRIPGTAGAQGRYPWARARGVLEARRARVAAARLGLGQGTTVWYDLEWFPPGNARCRASSLAFLSGWTEQLHRSGYRSGVYSSVSAGIATVGQARGSRRHTLPDQLWFAWANGRHDVSWQGYLDAPRWRQGRRVHQYALDVTARYGGVRMAIDRNVVDLGSSPQLRQQPAVCGRDADRPRYGGLHGGHRGARVEVAQCLLRAAGRDRVVADGRYGDRTRAEVRAFQRARRLPATGRVDRRTWTALLATGPRPVLKRGAEGPAVRRVQRALTAAMPGTVPVHGYFGPGTTTAVLRYQDKAGLPQTGVVSPRTWRALWAGQVVGRRPDGSGGPGGRDRSERGGPERGRGQADRPGGQRAGERAGGRRDGNRAGQRAGKAEHGGRGDGRRDGGRRGS